MPVIRSLTLISTPAGSTQAAGGENPSVSGDGRRVAFQSADQAFEPDAFDRTRDVFVKTPATGAVQRVSEDPAGPANDASINPVISDDGGTVAFVAEDLTPNDGEQRDEVFALDLDDGGAVRVPGGDLDPQGGDPDNLRPAIKADGGLVAFARGGTITLADRAAGTADTRQPDPVLADSGIALTPDGRLFAVTQAFDGPASSDLVTATANTVLTDRASGLGERLDGFGGLDETAILTPTDTRGAAVSADGRHVAYVREPGEGAEIVLQDRATDRIEVIAPAGRIAGGETPALSIDADGRRVAFSSASDDLVPGDANGVRDVFVYDRVTDEITRVSETPDGAGGDGASRDPEISADGEVVVFESRATNLRPGDADSALDVYRVRLDEPAFPAERVPEPVPDQARLRSDQSLTLDVLANDRDPDGAGLEIAEAAVTDGKVDVDVTPGDRLEIAPDRDAGGPATITYTVEDADGLTASSRVAVDIEPEDGVSVRGVADTGVDAGTIGDVAVGEDGEVIAFSATASDLVPEDANNARDAFVLDTADGSVQRVSETDDGAAPETGIGAFDLSPDGEALAFTSTAGNLVEGDTNGLADVFLKDLGTGDLERASVGPDGAQAGAPARAPAVADGGAAVAFVSAADNLVPGDANGEADIFVRDTGDGTLTRISEGIGDPLAPDRVLDIGADGRFVAYLDGSGPEGQGSVVLHDRADGTSQRFGPDVPVNGILPPSLSLSPDASTIALSRVVSTTLIDVETGETTAIAARPDGTEANFNTGGISLSEDGERAVFTSEATNLVAGDGNAADDVFVRDFENPDIDAVAPPPGPDAPDAGTAAISADGETAVFTRSPEAGGGDRLFVATLADSRDVPAPDANALPNATDARLTGAPGGTLRADLGERVTDPDDDGDALGFAIGEAPANGTATVGADGTLTYTPGADAGAGDSFTYTVTDPAGASDTATVRVEPVAAERNLTILDGTPQALTVPFRAEVRGTAAGERVTLESGADVTWAAGTDDGVALPGPLGSYEVAQTGTALVLSRPEDGTRATIFLNGEVEIGFADGVATAGLDTASAPPTVTLGGEAVGAAFDPDDVTLGPGQPGRVVPGPDVVPENLTVLDGTGQRLEIAYPGRVVGTAAAETLEVSGDDGAVAFAANAGDRVALPGALADAELDASGNVLEIDSAGAEAEIALNAAVEVAFADGTATARLADGEIRLGGEVVQPGFDAEAAELDATDVSALVTDGGNDGFA